MRRLWIALALFATTATVARAQEETPITKVVVPIVGTVNGANGVRWKTDLELVNDFGSELAVGLQLPTAPGEPAILLSLGPGETTRFTDVVGEAFGLEEALSPLVVLTMGRRSVTIRATVYGVKGAETFPPQPIAFDYGPSYFPLRNLQGLSFSDEMRTNIGLVNLGDQPAEFLLALQKLPGRTVATTRALLPPHSLWHTPIQTIFPLITKGDDFSIMIETLSDQTHVYASVIENETHAATFVKARVSAR